MTQKNYFIGLTLELLKNKLITKTEAKRIEDKTMKVLGYSWKKERIFK